VGGADFQRLEATAVTIPEGTAQLITSIGILITSLTGLVVSVRNSRKIDDVHKTTNSLAERAEERAHQAGVAEGKATEKANPT
jgi:uncharacterized membrane protein